MRGVVDLIASVCCALHVIARILKAVSHDTTAVFRMLSVPLPGAGGGGGGSGSAGGSNSNSYGSGSGSGSTAGGTAAEAAARLGSVSLHGIVCSLMDCVEWACGSAGPGPLGGGLYACRCGRRSGGRNSGGGDGGDDDRKLGVGGGVGVDVGGVVGGGVVGGGVSGGVGVGVGVDVGGIGVGVGGGGGGVAGFGVGMGVGVGDVCDGTCCRVHASGDVDDLVCSCRVLGPGGLAWQWRKLQSALLAGEHDAVVRTEVYWRWSLWSDVVGPAAGGVADRLVMTSEWALMMRSDDAIVAGVNFPNSDSAPAVGVSGVGGVGSADGGGEGGGRGGASAAAVPAADPLSSGAAPAAPAALSSTPALPLAQSTSVGHRDSVDSGSAYDSTSDDSDGGGQRHDRVGDVAAAAVAAPPVIPLTTVIERLSVGAWSTARCMKSCVNTVVALMGRIAAEVATSAPSASASV